MSAGESSMFVWTIENFSFCPQKTGEGLTSPTFTLDKNDWFIELFPRGEKQDHGIDCNLMRKKLKGMYRTVSVYFDFKFYNVERTVIAIRVSPAACPFPYNGFWGHGISEFVEKPDYLPLDTLIVQCRMWIDDFASEAEEHHVRTRFGKEIGSFTWSVDWNKILLKEKLSVSLTPASDLTSPSKLSLYMDDDKLRLEVTQLDTKYRNVFISELYVLVGGIKVESFAETEHIFEARKGEQVGHFNLIQTVKLLIQNKHAYFPEGVLFLQCNVGLSTGPGWYEIGHVKRGSFPDVSIYLRTLLPEFEPKAQTSKTMVDDIQCLYKDGALCDATLSAGGETFSAHKVILCARSPILRAKFCNPMKEKTSDLVVISDLSAETVRHMITYIYSDKVEDLQWEQVTQLYVAADKYQVLSLKKRCSQLLKEKLYVCNTCNLLIFADQYRDSDLKTHVFDFIFEHESEITEIDAWIKMQDFYPTLASETWKYLYLKMKAQSLSL